MTYKTTYEHYKKTMSSIRVFCQLELLAYAVGLDTCLLVLNNKAKDMKRGGTSSDTAGDFLCRMQPS